MTDKELFDKFTAYSFVLDDLKLYLDSHPNDVQALERFQEVKREYENLRNEYIKRCGLLTAKDESSTTRWSWTDDPWPWEIEGECK